MSIKQFSNFSTIWSGMDDVNLRPVLLTALTPSGWRPVNVAELGASVSGVTANVSVGAVSITGSSGVPATIQTVSGANALAVYIVSGQGGGGGSANVTTFPQVGISGVNGATAVIAAGSGYAGLQVVAIASGLPQNQAVTITNTVTTALSNPQVGITGSGLLPLQIISTGGYNSVPVVLTPGSVVGITGTFSASVSNPLSQIALTGSSGVAASIVTVSGSNAVAVYQVSGGKTLDAGVDTITVRSDISAVQSGTTALLPQFGKIAISGNGSNTVVSASGLKSVRLLAAQFISSGTCNITWRSSSGGADLTGPAAVIANVGEVLPYCPVGWFQTATGNSLEMVLSTGTVIGGSLVYVYV